MSEAVSKPVDDEDAMGAALVELREAKASGATPPDEPAAAATPAEPAAAATSDDLSTKPADAKPDEAQAKPAEKSVEQQLADQRAELHRLNSEIGRVNALNAKATTAAREVQELRKQLDEARKPPKTEAEARSKLAGFAEQVKDFPELKSLVEAVDAALTEVETKAGATAKAAAEDAVRPLAPLQQQHEHQQAEQSKAAYAADETLFMSTYPKAREVVGSDDFKAWLPKQSQDIRRAFFDGKTPGEALPVMDAYDAYLRRSGKPSIAVTPTTQQSAAEATKTTEAKPDTRLTRATGIPSRAGSAGKGSLPAQDDFDGSFEHFRAERLAKQARAAAA